MRKCLLILFILTLPVASFCQQLIPYFKGEAKWKITSSLAVKEKIKTETLSFPLHKKIIPDTKFNLYKREIRSDEKLIHNGITKPVQENISFTGKKLPAPEIFTAPPLQTRDNAGFNVSYTNKQHGYPGTNSKGFAEDDQHNVWIASGDGLLKYDGYHYYLYHDNSVYEGIDEIGIAFDNQKRLWIASENGIYFIRNDSLFSIKSTTLNFADLNGRRITIDHLNRIWIATKENGALCIDNNKTLIYDQRCGLPDNYIQNIFLDKKGNIYMGSGLSGMIIIEPGRMISLFQKPDKNNWRVYLCFTEDEDGIWAGTYSDGLILIGKKNVTQFSFTGKFTDQIDDILPVKGGLWISSIGNGVRFFNKTNFFTINETNGLADKLNYRLYKDSFGNIWISTLISGFSRINENEFYISDFDNPVLANITEEIPDSNKGKWLITFGNGLCYRKNSSIIQYVEPLNEKNKKMIYLADGIRNSDGSFWLGSYAWGLIKATTDQFTCYRLNESTENNIITSVKRDFSNTIWFSPIKYGLLSLQDNQFWRYTKKSGLLSDDIIRLYLDEKNQVNIVSASGLQRVTTRGLETFYIGDSLFKNIVGERIAVDPNTNILTTALGGLFILHRNQVFQLTTTNGLSSNKIKNITRDKSGRIWIATDKSIESFRLHNRVITDHQIYNQVNGSFVIDALDVQQDSTGEPRWNMNGKKLVFDSTFLPIENKHPYFYFDDMICGNDTIGNPDKIHLLPNQIINIPYRIIYWGRENYLKASYLLVLDSKDTTQITLPINGTIILNNLTPGEYKIILKATDNNNTYYSKSFKFVVHPFWYNSFLFRILFGSSLLIGIILYFKRKSLSQLRINAMLEGKVKEQTQMIREEKNALEKSFHTIEKQNKERETLIEEINHRVKNNLQFFATILEMQMNKEQSQEVLKALMGTSRRIKAMSLVHELLYDKKDTEGLSMISYIYQLVDNLKEMADTNIQPVSIKLDIDPIIMDAKKALAIGMIISELISNSYKYAFKNISKPEISISLKRNISKNNISLVLTDNGFGYASVIQPTSGLGSRLVDIFSRQLEAVYTLETDGKFIFQLFINDSAS